MAILVILASYIFVYLPDVVVSGGGGGCYVDWFLVLLFLVAKRVVVAVTVYYGFVIYKVNYHTQSTDITNQPNTLN